VEIALKKILVITGGFFPAQNYGGPPVSIDNMCTLLKNDFEFYILTSNHEFKKNKMMENITKGWNKRDNSKVLYLDEKLMNQKSFSLIINKIEPDVIYLNSFFSYKTTIPLIKIGRANNIKTILAPRGELCKNAFKKKYKKIPYLFANRMLFKNEFLYYQATSDEENEAIVDILGVSKKHIYKVTNVPTQKKQTKRCTKKESGKLNCVFLSRIHPKKNLLFALQCLKGVKGEIEFDIFGPIEDKEYWDKCKQYIRKLGENIIVKYKGIVQNKDVQNVFSQYDVFLFPTLSENFGHVIWEALLSNCPVIISNQTPWLDLQEKKCGYIISDFNISFYRDALKDLVEMSEIEYNKFSYNISRYCDNKFDYMKLKIEYENMFENI